jgi:hypothetical protein
LPFEVTTATAHIFAGHLLQREHPGPVILHSQEEYWPSFFLVVCLALLVTVRLRWLPRLARILQSAFSKQLLQQLEREEINPFRFYSIALNLLIVLNLGFICWKLNRLYGFVLPASPSLLQFAFFFLVILLIFVGKFLANRAIGFITGSRRLIAEYAVSTALVNQSLGVAIFPLVVLMHFSPFNPVIILWIALGLFAAALLLKWYRGVIKGLVQERLGFLQIFSYFCALEILPVFVLVKYIIETF